jgi:hypothetical protein
MLELHGRTVTDYKILSDKLDEIRKILESMPRDYRLEKEYGGNSYGIKQ